jgi:hypothetical protein
LFLTGGTPGSRNISIGIRAPMPDVESFVYWSKERLGGKAIISATHVSILRSANTTLPDVLVAGKGIFATHYLNASLSLTAIMRGRPGSPNYLAYVNRSEVDVVSGLFGGLVRVFMERRSRRRRDGSPRSAATAGERRSGLTRGAPRFRVRHHGIFRTTAADGLERSRQLSATERGARFADQLVQEPARLPAGQRAALAANAAASVWSFCSNSKEGS